MRGTSGSYVVARLSNERVRERGENVSLMAWMSSNVSRRRSLLLPDVAQASPSRTEGKIVTSSTDIGLLSFLYRGCLKCATHTRCFTSRTLMVQFFYL